MPDITQLTATQLLARFRDRSLSPVDATSACLARIRKADPALGAFCWIDEEPALAVTTSGNAVGAARRTIGSATCADAAGGASSPRPATTSRERRISRSGPAGLPP